MISEDWHQLNRYFHRVGVVWTIKNLLLGDELCGVLQSARTAKACLDIELPK